MELGFVIAIATVAVMVIERAKVAVRVTAIEIATVSVIVPVTVPISAIVKAKEFQWQ